MVPKGIIVLSSGVTAGDAPSAGAPIPALQRVANRPIVCLALEELHQAGVRDVALLVAERASAEVRAAVNAEGPSGVTVQQLVHQDGAPETALLAAAEFVGDDPCIVQVAEGLLAQPLAPLVGLLDQDAPDLLVLVHDSATGGESMSLAARRLLRLADSTPLGKAHELAGACLFGPGALLRVQGTRWWSDHELDLAPAAEALVGEGGRLRVHSVRGWRRYAGAAGDLLALNRVALDALLPESDGVSDPDTRIEGSVSVHPSACVQSSVIVGPAIVGPGALVLNSYIGPYTSIGADVRVEGAEIERSIILPGASITHVGSRLVASIVGRDARIFRDFSLPRALRFNVGDGGEVALC
jgi:glucose-1-phosphate thymidylyltransferase